MPLPQNPNSASPALLGEVWWFYFDFVTPGIRVDAYLYRPLTLGGWPFAGGPTVGTWWWTGPDSSQRRQSLAAYQLTDEWGWYYAEFMFPRDNVWYPCGFPLQWQCNYVVDQLGAISGTPRLVWPTNAAGSTPSSWSAWIGRGPWIPWTQFPRCRSC